MKLRYIITSLITLVLVGCGGHDGPEQPAGVSRTVLVYMAAANSLGHGSYSSRRWDIEDIREMTSAVQAGALDEGGRLLVYHAGSGMVPELKEITRDGVVTLRRYEGEGSPVSVAVMRGVLDDMRTVASADEYGLVLWSHASGWMIDNGKSPEGRSWGVDESEGKGSKAKEMAIPDLARALDDQHLLFIYFDCCFMGNIESLYEVKDAARYVVASPTETPLAGMPYEENVPCFFSKVPDLRQVAKNTFDYYDAKSGSDRSIAISLYDMSKIDAVAAAYKNVLAVNKVPADGYSQQQYGYGRTYGNRFYDFAHYVKSLTDDSSLLGSFDRAMSDFVLYTDNTPSMWGGEINLIHCNGVSSYIITGTDDYVASTKGYYDLRWWNDVVSPAFGN